MTPTTQPAEHTKMHTEGINSDGTVSDTTVETYYMPWTAMYLTGEYVRIIADDGGTDIETRIPIKDFVTVADKARALAGIPAPESAIEQAREALELSAQFATSCRGRLSGQMREFMLEVEQKTRAALSNLTPATDKQG